MGIHDGHRARMLTRFTENGFDGMSEHEKLEVILYFSVPRADTNEVAHRLIDKYHTVSAVMDAPAKELTAFSQITERTVMLFRMMKETELLCRRETEQGKAYLITPDEISAYFQLRLATAKEEKLMVLSLNRQGRFLGCNTVSDGDLSSVGLSTRKLVQIALNRNAGVMVLGHNHPGGIALPSNADVEITKKAAAALNSVNVRLGDHIIVTEDDYYSMANHSECQDLFDRT